MIYNYIYNITIIINYISIIGLHGDKDVILFYANFFIKKYVPWWDIKGVIIWTTDAPNCITNSQTRQLVKLLEVSHNNLHDFIACMNSIEHYLIMFIRVVLLININTN